MEKYRQIYETLSNGQKIVFLEKILKNSPELQSQLVNYYTNDQQNKKIISFNFNEAVISEAATYKDALESINLEEPDYDRYHSRNDRYYEEWEIAQEAAEEEINEVFDAYRDEFVNLVSKGDLHVMMAKLTGLLIACYEAEIDDPYDNLGDPQEFLAECLGRIAKSVESELIKTILNEEMIAAAVKDVIDCFVKGEANKFPTAVHDSLIHCLLKNNIGSGKMIYHEFTSEAKSRSLFPNSYIQSIRYGNPEQWITEAEKMSTTSIGVAKELLESQAENHKDAFHRNAKILFPLFSRELVELISESMDDRLEKQFAKEVLSFKVLNSHQIEDYKRLSGLFSEGEKNFFVVKLATASYYEFYINVLEYEGKFEQILKYAENPGRSIWEYPFVMKPILHKFPAECFAIAANRARTYLESNMSRNDYQNVAQLLITVALNEKNIAGVTKLTQELCTLYSRRSAMKDEFRKAGLLK